MKFAHLADTHLGYRQFGLHDREKDFYEVFEKTINKIIDEKVDFVIHSGDLFESSKPSPIALLVFQKALLKLKGVGIPVYATAGNHDTTLRKDSIPPQVLYKKHGLKVISPINSEYIEEDGTFICGVPYYPKSKKTFLKEKLGKLSKKAEEYDKKILVLHQGIDKYLPFEYELEIGDIPENFNYYALGHIHNYIEDDYGEGKLVYPGSMDIWKSSELSDYNKNGKGFCIVEMDGSDVSVKRISIDIPREFISITVDEFYLNQEILNLKSRIAALDNKPILNITIENPKSSSADIYDMINKELGDLCLLIRPSFKVDEKDDESIDISNIDTLEPKSLLHEHLKSFDNEDISDLAIDLYEKLSNDNVEESEKLIEDFYDDYFEKIDITDEDIDLSKDASQTDLKEFKDDI
ncbi:exonuclease SbcCD subunit D [Methanobrevibacter sp. DSM 116169]|uniref:metallophosphoesterase family protein n=1 Tax=Methanobrevibacter sp. DSM 116169 TaxID=3242727 RepID=UPI0038FCCC6C